MRLIAVALVLLSHATFSASPFPPVIAETLEALRRGGWIGVDLFFVLSGYLVSGLLFSEHQRYGRAQIGRFLVRRGLKIYPAFWALLAYTCVSIFRRGADFPPAAFLGELLFLQNYLGQLLGYTWSLAVEEHFYIVLALVVALLQKRGHTNPFTAIPPAFVFIAITCLTLRILEAQRAPAFAWYDHMTPTHLRADSLFFGVLLSYATQYRGLAQSIQGIPTSIMITLACVLMLPAFVLNRDDHRWLTVIGYNLFYIASGLLVLAFIRIRFAPSRLISLLSTLGAASYSIYLWHGPMAAWTSRLSKSTSALQQLLYLCTYIIGSLAFGFFMSRIVEMPVLRIRDRYFSARSSNHSNTSLPVSR